MTVETTERRERTSALELPRMGDEQRRELDGERRGREHLAGELERVRRGARLQQRLLEVVAASGDLETLTHGVVTVLAEAAQADLAVLRLADAQRLKTIASVGLEEEVVEQHTVPLPVRSTPSEITAAAMSAHAVRKGARVMHAVPLFHEHGLVAVAGVGLRGADVLDDETAQLLQSLAGHAAQAIARLRALEVQVQASRARDEVLAVVAHDLRNPLNVISIAANGLMQKLPDGQARRPLERIIRGAQRAERLIRDLLEVSAIEGGRFAIQARPVEAAELLLAAIESQQALVTNASVIIASDLSPELPQLDADDERIHEVLENLVGNAVKFTGAGGTITIGASAREGEVVCWVKDSGPGIPADHLPHLFDRFWQARKADRRGAGLGLTICKAIVEAHGGRIWAESVVGEGTTMFFTLPAMAQAPRALPTEAAPILLVDDRPENLLSLKAILDRPDYRLVTASSGEEALRLALKEPFALALVDVAMPGMNGFEVATHLKALERSRTIPIIFITAFGDDPQEIERAYSAGGVDYLVKPLNAEIVRKKVAVFVDLSRRKQHAEPAL